MNAPHPDSPPDNALVKPELQAGLPELAADPSATKGDGAPPAPTASHDRRLIWYGLLAAFVFIRSLLFLAVIPPWQGPDEPGHFEYIALIDILGLIPSRRPNVEVVPELTRAINESARTQRFEQFQAGINIPEQSALTPPVLVSPREAGYQRPTYYLLAVPIYHLLRGQSILVAYYGVAMISVLLGVVTVLAAAATARTVLPNQRLLQLAIPLLVAFWPTQSYMTTRVTNDNLVTAVAAVTFWLGADIMRRGLRPWASVGLLAALILAAYTKGTSLFLVGFGVLVFGYGLARRYPQRGPRGLDRALITLGLVTLVVVGLAVFDPAFAKLLLPVVALLPPDNRVTNFLTAALRAMAVGLHLRPDRLALTLDSAYFTLRSFWAVFGWGRYLLPAMWYQIAAGAAGVALLGWLRRAWRARRGVEPLAGWQGRTLGLFVIAIPFALLPLVSRMIFDPYDVAFHGRILQTLLVPVTMLLALGWRQWVPPAWRKASLFGLLFGLVLFDAVIFTNVLLPRFYS